MRHDRKHWMLFKYSPSIHATHICGTRLYEMCLTIHIRENSLYLQCLNILIPRWPTWMYNGLFAYTLKQGWRNYGIKSSFQEVSLQLYATIVGTRAGLAIKMTSMGMMTSSNGNIFRVTCHLCGSPVNSPHKSQWRGALIFSLICAWINDWVNNREAGDLRRYYAHYDVIVMGRLPVTTNPVHYDESHRVLIVVNSWSYVYK